MYDEFDQMAFVLASTSMWTLCVCDQFYARGNCYLELEAMLVVLTSFMSMK